MAISGAPDVIIAESAVLKVIMKPSEVYQEILKLDLHRIVEFDSLTESEFVRIYNEGGPDNWADELKGIMKWVYRNLESIIAVYDIEYYFNDGTLRSWERSLDDWKYNIPVILSYRYPLWKFWLIPRRIFVSVKIRKAYQALQAYRSGAAVASKENEERA